MSSHEEETLVEAALRVLNTADPFEKARLGDSVASRWLHGAIALPYHPSRNLPVPDRPARLSNVKLVAPSLMPKLGKAGSLQSRIAIVHSLAHTESWAIDLSWDIIARFGKQEAMPREFFTDFVKVAQDEGRHFTLLAARLEELGSYYGALPAHDGLWDSATATSKDLLSRLAVEHCVHEARGLDVLPTTISRFRNGGDDTTAELLERVVYPEEITHCAAGVKWFKYLCQRSRKLAPDTEEQEVCSLQNEMTTEQNEVIQKFHEIVRTYFRGPLKPPFNETARKAAGFGPEWYEPLAVTVNLITHKSIVIDVYTKLKKMLSLCSFLLPLLLLLGISLYIFNNIHYSRWDSKVAIDADKRMCSSGWCGRHDIRYPFRLNNSSPSHCGDHRYTLSCENDNQLFLYLKSIKLKVQSINYNNYTIRLVDANVALHTHNHSSLLPYSLTSSNFSRMGYEQYQYRFYTHHFNDGISLIKQMLYVRCPPYGVESSAAASCMNGSYALGSTIYVSDIDKTLQDLAFGDSCQIEWIYLTSWPTEIKHKNISCTDIHHMLLSGFELSWLQAYCNNETFFAMLGDHNNIGIHQAGSPMTNPSGTAEAHKVGDPPKQANSIPILHCSCTFNDCFWSSGWSELPAELLELARGLDVLPTTISRFRNGGDDTTAELLERVVYPEEITHCAAGVKWFKYLCQRSRKLAPDTKEQEVCSLQNEMTTEQNEVIPKFHEIVKTYFREPLKPPFNETTRKAAGFGPEWYEPLAVKEANQSLMLIFYFISSKICSNS
ncbi:hypothetical protein Ahy_A07g034051 isoform B [Arachis hypogaea]|uniref:Wall-associated receptor kinase galacturonan-binding domain-containing protein n=1 Tax=Arachis hypogaea TaxID=3818 RepID=A0A445CAU9_ARAHY|nr:hypothetical protein Ahy_A07g034051 isoform B [Arachis hypogaea]